MKTSPALSILLLAGLAVPLAAQSAGPLEIVPRANLSIPGQRLGRGLSLSGDDLLVRGASQQCVFHRSAGTWTPQEVFHELDGMISTCSRRATDVAIAGDRLAIGEPFHGSTGRVWTSRRSGASWSAPTYIEDQNVNGFGQAVLFVRGILLAGAPDEGSTGFVTIWKEQASGWQESGKLWAPPARQMFGSLLASSGSTLLVAEQESAKVFLQGTNPQNWSFQALLDPPGDALVRAIAIDGDVAVLSTDADVAGCSSSPAEVLVFERSGTTWSQTTVLVAADSAPPALGSSVSVRGDTIFVGAGVADGAVYVFQRLAGAWTQTAKISSNPPLGSSAAFGSSIARDGTTLCVGAPGSASIDPGAVQVFDVVSLPPPATYCTAKVNSLGCLPQMSAVGIPGLTNPGAFELRATNVVSRKIGFLLYSTAGSAATPYQGGILCLAPSIHRTPAQASGGNPPPNDCSGTYTFDFNARARSGVDPALQPGVQVWAQYYSRDPGDPFGIGLTDAVTFTIGS